MRDFDRLVSILLLTEYARSLVTDEGISLVLSDAIDSILDAIYNTPEGAEMVAWLQIGGGNGTTRA